jgi:NTE family protein
MPFFVTRKKKVTVYESNKSWYDFRIFPLGFSREEKMVAKKDAIAMGRFIGIFMFMLVITCCTPKTKEIRPGPEVEAPPPPKPAKIALVLGAGASKGFAHVGVIKILESNKIPIHMIVGTSVGSVVGGFYAYGLNTFELQKLSSSIEQKDIVDLTIPDNGFIKGEKLEEFVNKTVKNTVMEKMKIPSAIA